MLNSVPAVTDEQVQSFRENGYLIVNDLLTPEECDELNARAVDVVQSKVKLAENNHVYFEPEAVEQGLVSEEQPDPAYLFKIGHEMHVTDLIFRYYAMHDRILDILTKLIGPNIKCVQSMYIDKPKKIGVGQPYHQDSYYLKFTPETLVGVWVACDDVDIQNGCLHVIPGSHTEPVHPHEVPVDPTQRKYFQEVHAARERAEVPCVLPKGAAVFFPGTMLHRSGNNVTPNRQRRAYVLHYADAQSKSVNNPAARNPHLLVRGRQFPGCI